MTHSVRITALGETASLTIARFYPMIRLRMAHALETPLLPLVRDFRELEARARAVVLATVVASEGSRHRKAGVRMLITAAGPA
jgi:XdhC and CoxI family